MEKAPTANDGVSSGRHASAVALDRSQRAVLARPDDGSALVLGAPGTGKTTTLVELVADRVLTRGLHPDSVLAVTSSRATATRLRDRLAARVSRPSSGPFARSIASLAFEIVGAAARLAGALEPTLLSGGDQDTVIAELLAGHLEDASGPRWPATLDPAVRSVRVFRTELRELMMRATERGVPPERMRRWGTEHGRPEWVAAADFMTEYLSVVSQAHARRLDSAELVGFAVAALARGESGAGVDRLRLVLVDDVQELSRSALSLVAALAERGVAVVAFGDPDVTTSAFRGAEATTVQRLERLLGLAASDRLTLSTTHRQNTVLRRFVRSITDRVGTAGVVGHRQAVAVRDGDAGSLAVLEASSAAEERAAIARVLRRRHLLDAVSWDAMAVIVRSGASVGPLVRSLTSAGVPARSAARSAPLREDPAVWALAAIVDVAVGRRPLTAETAERLLLSPFGGLDRVGLRRARQHLRSEEDSHGGNRTTEELVVEALRAPGTAAVLRGEPARRLEALARTLAAVAAGAAEGRTIEELLWSVWEPSEARKQWRARALASGSGTTEADRALDAVGALFTAAQRFVEREPDSGPEVFLHRVFDTEVPEDTLSPRAVGSAVTVTTPTAALATEFDTVVIARLQQGVWPDLRLRGSLLGAEDFVRVAEGVADEVIDERRAVLDDELRMFALAASRARERLVLTAVGNDDETPSTLLSLPVEAVRAPAHGTLLTLRGLVGRLRREVTAARAPRERRAQAACALARLAAEGVEGADPLQWHGLASPSTLEPLPLEGEQVTVSPSKLEAFERSGLDWFVDAVSGSRPSAASGLGILVHRALEAAPAPDAEAVWEVIAQHFDELEFDAVWARESERRAARGMAVAIARYLSDADASGVSLVAAEQGFDLELDGVRVRGTVDRLERDDDGTVTIVDLKSGRSLPSLADAERHAQLAVYQFAYRSGAFDAVLEPLGPHHGGAAKLLYVRLAAAGKPYDDRRRREALDDETTEAVAERIRVAADGMSAAAFTGPRRLPPHGVADVAVKRLLRVPAVCSDEATR